MGKTMRREKTKRSKKCPNGTRRNKKTGICQKNGKSTIRKQKYNKNIFKPIKMVSKIIEIKSRTPKSHIELRESLNYPQESIKINETMKSITESIYRSFSPSINKELVTLKSMTPEANIFICPIGEINIKTTRGYKCKSVYDNSPEIKRMMLGNLNVKAKKINYDLILSPKQFQSNCWFNVFFMAFFISDKGRKFFRYLRKAMITGILPNKTSIEADMKMPLFLLNFFIEASFVGENDPARFGEVMNTNVLIQQIGNALKTKNLHYYDVGKSGNPIRFYLNIMRYLNTKPIKMMAVTAELINQDLDMFLCDADKTPDILYLNQPNTRTEELKTTYIYTIKKHTVKYVLDSAIVRSQNKEHYSCYITGNKKEYAFDGASFSYLTPFEWKDKINLDTTWKFQDQHEEVFDFKTCTVVYFYYRS